MDYKHTSVLIPAHVQHTQHAGNEFASASGAAIRGQCCACCTRGAYVRYGPICSYQLRRFYVRVRYTDVTGWGEVPISAKTGRWQSR